MGSDKVALVLTLFALWVTTHSFPVSFSRMAFQDLTVEQLTNYVTQESKPEFETKSTEKNHDRPDFAKEDEHTASVLGVEDTTLYYKTDEDGKVGEIRSSSRTSDLSTLSYNGSADFYDRFKRHQGVCQTGSSCPILGEDGERVCFKDSDVCNGIVDCPLATEEENCQCHSRISSKYLCDGVLDCFDITDELGCNGCQPHQLHCMRKVIGGTQEACMTIDEYCDHHYDCEGKNYNFLCTKLSLLQEPSKVQFDGMRSSGYLQVYKRSQWIPVCHTEKDDESLTAFIEGYCSDIVGQRIDQDVYSLETVSGTPPKLWAVIKENSTSVKSSCSVNSLVYVHCGRPVCQPISSFLNTVAKEATRIVGGTATEQESWPFLVLIRRNGIALCGGSILNESYILTAGHCLERLFDMRFEVAAGISRLKTYPPFAQLASVSHITVHENFVDHSSYDIAILKLETPLQLNKWVAPVCFAEHAFSLQPGTPCVVAGWGHQQEGSGKTAEELMMVTAPILTDSACLNYGSDFTKVLCAGSAEGGRDSCGGDSGGPLMCSSCQRESFNSSCPWFQAGIVSYGLGCARPGWPGVYTRISFYRSWIITTMKNMQEDPAGFSFVSAMNCTGHVCQSIHGLCFPEKKLCDGKIDCLDGSDESRQECSKAKGLETVLEYASDKPAVTTEELQLQNEIFDIFTEIEGICDEESFICSEFPQCIPYDLLCDGHKNCHDGTDEYECACADYLFKQNADVICDGIADCEDQSDEHPQYCKNLPCDTGEWFCPESHECILLDFVCDGYIDCLHMEDERFCVHLTATLGIANLDSDGLPVLNPNGYIMAYKRGQHVWSPVCTDDLEQDVSNDTCHYLGYSQYVSVEYNQLSLNYTAEVLHNRKKRSARNGSKFRSPINRNNAVLDSSYTRSETLKVKPKFPRRKDFYRKSSDSLTSDLFWKMYGHALAESRIQKRETCSHVRIECANRICGQLESFHFTEESSRGAPREIPWAVGIYKNGIYACGGTLVDSSWAISSVSCLGNLSITEDVPYVVGGSYRSRNGHTFWSPKERSQRVDYFRQLLDSDMLLLHLEDPMPETRTINRLCLPDRVAKWSDCLMTGLHGEYYVESMLLELDYTSISGSAFIFKHYIGRHNMCPNRWAGLIACRQHKLTNATWYAAGIWQHNGNEHDCSYPLSHHLLTSDLLNLIKTAMSEPVQYTPLQHCSGFRCVTGKCIPWIKVCDAIVDCPDQGDEPEDCPPPPWNCLQDGKRSCTCMKNEFKCDGYICIDHNKVCNGIDDCPEGEDERNCSCLQVLNNTNPEKICDGHIDCADETDEGNCGCDDEFWCYKSSDLQCIQEVKVCNNFKDCSDGEDEQHCFALSPILPVKENSLRSPAVHSDGYFVFRMYGRWFTALFSIWKIETSDVVCKKLGFQQAVKTTSAMLIHHENIFYDSRIISYLKDLPFSKRSFIEKVVYIECLK